MQRLNGFRLVLALSCALLQWAPNTAQAQRCCDYSFTQHFRVCIPSNCTPRVHWGWNTQAAAWQFGFPPFVNVNSGSHSYSIPSSDAKCAHASRGDCAAASACAEFTTSLADGNCIVGSHRIYGRACAACGEHGAGSRGYSTISFSCRSWRPPFTNVWLPDMRREIRRGCSVVMFVTIDALKSNPNTGETRRAGLVRMEAEGVLLTTENQDGEVMPQLAKVSSDGNPSGHITIATNRLNGSSGSFLLLRWENGIVTASENTGDFSDLNLPRVGERIPEPDQSIVGIRPVQIVVDDVPGWQIEQLEMAIRTEAGDRLPSAEGDVNGDGCVDDSDLLIVLFHFGNQGGEGDVNNDNIVDDSDLLIVLFNFGLGC